MAHKYQELSMISLLYYQETLTADAEGRRLRGDQNCYSGAILYLLSHTYARPGVVPEQVRDAGLPPIRSRSQQDGKQHSVRSLVRSRARARAVYVCGLYTRSRPNSI